MVKDKKIRATIEGHISFESTLRGIDVGESRPTGTGGGTQRNGDARKREAMGQQLAGVQHFSTAGGQNSVTALSFGSHSLQILLTAIELELSLKGIEPLGLEIQHQKLTLICSGSTATEDQRT